ncbi:MAG TPA: Ig-like domain-containing protein [Kofleriaceae bacterium]|jgi:Tol biopolymer transport system component|nr:Ig-like domain-containing protein [Kofleriaceae bacterium]
MLRRLKLSCLVPVLAVLFAGCGGMSDGERPILEPVTATTPEDTPVDLHVLDGSQATAGRALQVIRATASGHQVQIIGSSTIRLTPAQDFNGTIDVSFQVSDGSVEASGVAMVTVTPVNDAPIAMSTTLNVGRGADVTLIGSDIDSNALQFTIVTPPNHGTLTGTPPTMHYAADPTSAGDDVFSFQVSDGQRTSGVASVLLHVTGDAAPAGMSYTAQGFEDAPLPFGLVGSDADGDPLHFTIEAMPQHGTISGTPPDLVYQPDADFNGDDALQFSVSDGTLRSKIATVTLQINPINDAPVAQGQTVEATEDTPVDVALAGSDVDGDPLTFQVSGSVADGTVAITGATARFTPRANFNGTTSFRVVAFDGHLFSPPATVTIHVAPVNDAPVASPLSIALDEDGAATIVLAGSDVDGDALQFAVADPPQHGALTGTPPRLTYTPAADHNGPDSFTFTATDGSLTSPPATVSITVRSVDDPPVPVSTTVTTDEDTPVTVALQATDIDSSNLTFSIAAAPPDGSFTLSGASLTYTPALDATGRRTFTFRVSDGTLSATGTVTIDITPVNDPPVAHDDYVATDPFVPLTIDVLANDVDPDGDTLQIDSFDAPAHGTVARVDGKLVYTPNPDEIFTGIDAFHYTVSDGHGASSTALVHVGVGEFPPDAPAETLPHITADSTDRDNAPSLSADGRYIAFTSFQPLTSDDTNGVGDVYVYDRGTRTLTRVSVASDGTQGNATSTHAQISGNGRYVVFDSGATNLVDGDGNGVRDVFRHDLQTGATIRVSVASSGGEANGASTNPVISDDGQVIAYTSSAFNLVAGDANGASDVFVTDFQNGPINTVRVSVSMVGGDGDFASSQPAISGNGRVVSFTSSATNMVSGDTNNVSDVFVHDRFNPSTSLVSQSTGGVHGDQFSNASSISGDGRFVSFVSQATTLVAPLSAAANRVYVRDNPGRVTTRPSPLSLQVIWARLSGDGRYLVQQAATGVQVVDRFTPATATLNTTTWLWPMVSSNGRYIAVIDTAGGGGSVLVVPNPL